MKSDTNVLNQLRGWRIWIPLLIGLSTSIWLLVRSLNETRFIEVSDTETGTHSWKDSNGNGEVDFWIAEEFTPDASGNYRQETLTDVLKSIDWTLQSVFWLLAAFLMMALRDFG